MRATSSDCVFPKGNDRPHEAAYTFKTARTLRTKPFVSAQRINIRVLTSAWPQAHPWHWFLRWNFEKFGRLFMTILHSLVFLGSLYNRFLYKGKVINLQITKKVPKQWYIGANSYAPGSYAQYNFWKISQKESQENLRSKYNTSRHNAINNDYPFESA